MWQDWKGEYEKQKYVTSAKIDDVRNMYRTRFKLLEN